MGPSSDHEDNTVTALARTTIGASEHEPSQVDILRATPAAEINQTIQDHIRVYAIGDAYNIIPLKTLAKAKISDLLDTNWSSRNLAAAIKKAIDSIRNRALYKFITSPLPADSEYLINWLEELARVKFKYDFPFEASQATIDKYALELEAARSELASVKSQLASVESQLYDEITKSACLIETFDNCVRTVSKTDVCRYCSAKFNCFIETRGEMSTPIYTVRCAECRCRQHNVTS